MTTTLTAGLSLKPQHFEAAHACRHEGLWLEIHPENYFVEGGPRLAWLDAIRAHHPLSLHGVALSLAADAPPDAIHLKRLKALADRVAPVLVSEHLAWSSWQGDYYPDLLPFPRTTVSLQRIVDNITITQDVLGRRIAIENPSQYLHIEGHAWDEIDFLNEIAQRSGCGLLLDVNNVHVAAQNLGYSAADYIDRIPASSVMEIHLAGHTSDPNLGKRLLIDSHDEAVAPAVWALYRRLIARIGQRPTLIERDANLPEFDVLLQERQTAHDILVGCSLETALP